MTPDVLIRNGKIVDGTGHPRFIGDVAVQGARILDVGRFPGATAERVIEAAGKVVCPGFIDMHTHSDLMLLAHPQHEGKIAQGVVTDVIGQDGLSYAPVNQDAIGTIVSLIEALNGKPELDYGWRSVSDYLERFDGKTSVNVAYLVPHAAVRVSVIWQPSSPQSLRDPRTLAGPLRAREGSAAAGGVRAQDDLAASAAPGAGRPGAATQGHGRRHRRLRSLIGCRRLYLRVSQGAGPRRGMGAGQRDSDLGARAPHRGQGWQSPSPHRALIATLAGDGGSVLFREDDSGCWVPTSDQQNEGVVHGILTSAGQSPATGGWFRDRLRRDPASEVVL